MDGIERLRKLAEGQEDISLNRVIAYLTSVTDMNEKYNNEEKSLKQMTDYIKGEAKKIAKDGYCWVEDATVFTWAIDYWNKTNEELGIKKQITIPKIETKVKEIVPEVQTMGQLSLF